MTPREEFYKKNVLQFLEKDSSVLICGGGGDDKKILALCGFTNVIVSNINADMAKFDWTPFRYVVQNAESLSYPDQSFDYVIIHEAVHHASSPHRVVTEMYRVARKGVLAIEVRDSIIIIMRLVIKLNFTQDYEYRAIYMNGCTGGVNNTEIPNFIFRWTEWEIEKTIQSYAPYAKHKFYYNYGTRFPFMVRFNKNPISYLILKFIQPFYYLFTIIFKRQQNLFAFFIKKPDIPKDLYPWLKYDTNKAAIVFDKEWGEKHLTLV